MATAIVLLGSWLIDSLFGLGVAPGYLFVQSLPFNQLKSGLRYDQVQTGHVGMIEENGKKPRIPEAFSVSILPE